MNKSTLIITGANGYLGSCFVDYFRNLGWEVKAFVHRVPGEKKQGVHYVNYSLENTLSEKEFEGVSAVIHGAYVRYDKNKNADAINFEGTQRLISFCDQRNIPIAYLSSFSAHKGAISHYGTSKLKCEHLFDTSRHSILKIGFIIGKEGILGEMIQRIEQSRLFPLVGGKQPLQSIGMEDLCEVVYTVVAKELTGIFYSTHEEVLTMKDFYKAVASRLDKKLTFVPIPMNVFYLACKFFEALGLKIPVSSESVLGLKKLTTFKTVTSQQALGIQFKNHQECLDALFKDKNEMAL